MRYVPFKSRGVRLDTLIVRERERERELFAFRLLIPHSNYEEKEEGIIDRDENERKEERQIFWTYSGDKSQREEERERRRRRTKR